MKRATLQASWHPLWGCEAAPLNIVEVAIGGMGRAKRSRSASTTLREVPGAESGARAPEPVSRAAETGNAPGLIPASPPRSPSPAQRGRKRALSATPMKRAGDPPQRPTQREEAGAARVVERLKAAGLVQHVGRPPSLKLVACAVVLHDGLETFPSDSAAKRAFGVDEVTDVRQQWVEGKLARLLEYEKAQNAAQAAQVAAEAAAARPVPRREAERAAKRAATEAAKGARCEGTTNLNVRCMVYANSGHKEAEPLQKGGRFCTWHDPALRAARVADFAERSRDAVRCAGRLKGTHRPCRLTSAMWHGEAEPLRRGSPFCHHHRVRCEGRVRGGDRCCVTSSSSHAHAAPLRRGAHFCAHHTARVACTLSVGPTVKLTLAVRAR